MRRTQCIDWLAFPLELPIFQYSPTQMRSLLRALEKGPEARSVLDVVIHAAKTVYWMMSIFPPPLPPDPRSLLHALEKGPEAKSVLDAVIDTANTVY